MAQEEAILSEAFRRLNKQNSSLFIEKFTTPGLNKKILLGEMGILRLILQEDNI